MSQEITALLKEYADVQRILTKTDIPDPEENETVGVALRRGFMALYDALTVTWIPCEEKMPTAGKKVWAWCTAEDGFSFWGHWNWQEPIWVDPCGKGPYPVSHWMEIRWPEPPAG